MNVLRKAEAPASAVHRVGVKICKFANGSCDCTHRDRLCERVEVVPAAIFLEVEKLSS